MADPFSIIAGTAGLTDVCIRFANVLKQAKDGFQSIDEDLESLSEEIGSLQAVNDLVERSYEAGASISIEAKDQQVFNNHWHATRTTLSGSQRIVEQLSTMLLEIVNTGSGKHTKRDKLRKYLKQQSKEGDFNACRQKLSAHQVALQTSLAAVTVSAFWLSMPNAAC